MSVHSDAIRKAISWIRPGSWLWPDDGPLPIGVNPPHPPTRADRVALVEALEAAAKALEAYERLTNPAPSAADPPPPA